MTLECPAQPTGELIARIEFSPEPIQLRSRPFRTVVQVQRAVCKHYKITLAEMLSPSRARRLAHPRQVAIAICCRRLRPLGYSFPMIARLFRRDHTTCMYAAKKFGYQTDPHMAERSRFYMLARYATATAIEQGVAA